MLKTEEILERFDLIDREMYGDMLRQVNIPDFYKCMAQFSGLAISRVSDDAIVQYLQTWAKNKYRFYKMLGNSLRLDQPFKYIRQDKNLVEEFNLLGKEFPAYFHWLKDFSRATKNKIDMSYVGWQTKDNLRDLFPQTNIEGSSLTHFFKAKLNAPDELVTKIGRIFENDEIEATHTISINPVDMMLASENPYDWNSCYRLEWGRSDSHADGCMAAILDTSSLITYVWDKEGEFSLYDHFKFKKIRYYRMRGWIAIEKEWKAIHFNGVYPGRSRYDDEFLKQLRDVVENVVASYAKIENKWRKNAYVQVKSQSGDWTYNRAEIHCNRTHYYGYNEYDDCNIYVNSQLVSPVEGVQPFDNFKSIEMPVYDEYITCPCGCGTKLVGSDDCVDEYDEGICYNGDGFICDNFYENEPEYKWCPYRDDYCCCGCMECDDCDEECEIYQDNNPVCSLDGYTLCDDPDFDEVHHGQMPACSGHCSQCWMWERHHPADEAEQQQEEEKKEEE